MKKTRDELEEARLPYLELKQLTQQRGWDRLQLILRDEFHAALDTLASPKTVKAEVEARGVVKFIKKLMDRVNSELEFGKLAQEEYVRTYINPKGDSKSA